MRKNERKPVSFRACVTRKTQFLNIAQTTFAFSVWLPADERRKKMGGNKNELNRGGKNRKRTTDPPTDIAPKRII